ncbi:MAG: hypothetical protein LC116_10540 [Bacteroidetes bacterium]|nr:hypothetical protein [Bacteroidota bacterium]MCZ2133588.1 hypothetical protein [Bacteroidota bacterium]
MSQDNCILRTYKEKMAAIIVVFAMRHFLATAVFILLFTALAQAQGGADEELSSPIDPMSTFYPFRLGGVLGAGPAVQNGELKTTACDCPTFIGGGGYSMLGGLAGEYYLDESIATGLLLTIDFRSIDALYREYEAVPLMQSSTGEIITQRVQFRHSATVSTTALAVNPFVKFHPFKKIFVQTGPSFNFGISSSLRHEKELLDHIVRLPNGEDAEISLDRSDPRVFSATKALIQDSELPKLKNPMLFWNFAAGIDINAGRKTVLTPLVQYSVPLGELSSSGDKFSISNWAVMAEVKVKFR